MAEQIKKTKPIPRTALRAAKRTYQAEILGLPPLKMVLVHAQNDRLNAAMKPSAKTKTKRKLSQQEAVIKIIEHLTKIQ